MELLVFLSSRARTMSFTSVSLLYLFSKESTRHSLRNFNFFVFLNKTKTEEIAPKASMCSFVYSKICLFHQLYKGTEFKIHHYSRLTKKEKKLPTEVGHTANSKTCLLHLYLFAPPFQCSILMSNWNSILSDFLLKKRFVLYFWAHTQIINPPKCSKESIWERQLAKCSEVVPKVGRRVVYRSCIFRFRHLFIALFIGKFLFAQDNIDLMIISFNIFLKEDYLLP